MRERTFCRASSALFARIVGAARALDLFWSGRVVDAREAERMGIATRVVADDQLSAVVSETARSIAAKPQEAIRVFKRAVYQSFEMPLAAHLDMVSSHMAVVISSIRPSTRRWSMRTCSVGAVNNPAVELAAMQEV
jgi:enoyl-CoA hydratase/carnithine racemase